MSSSISTDNPIDSARPPSTSIFAPSPQRSLPDLGTSLQSRHLPLPPSPPYSTSLWVTRALSDCAAKWPQTQHEEPHSAGVIPESVTINPERPGDLITSTRGICLRGRTQSRQRCVVYSPAALPEGVWVKIDLPVLSGQGRREAYGRWRSSHRLGTRPLRKFHKSKGSPSI